MSGFARIIDFNIRQSGKNFILLSKYTSCSEQLNTRKKNIIYVDTLEAYKLVLKDLDFQRDSIITDNNIISLKSSIKFEGYIDQVKLKNKLKKAQVLLLSSVNLEGVNNIIPGKLFLYLSVKRPILAFSSLNSDVEDIINTTKSGKVFDYLNKIDLKDYILELYNQFKKRNNHLNSVGIDQYNYKSLSNKLSDIINKTIQINMIFQKEKFIV